MTYRELNGYVTYVGPPYSGPDMALLHPFAGKYKNKAVHIYTPFDPNTWKIPQDTSNFIGRDLKYAYGWFSPNVYQLFIREYVKHDENGNPYFYEFPVLMIDYDTPVEALYSGPNKPGDRPLDMQFEDWKQGIMWSRRHFDEEKKVVACVGNEWSSTGVCIPKEFKFREGWYWTGYQARLISVPATLLVGVSDVMVFEYRKPKSVVWKIPGFRNVVDYIIKKRLNNEAVAELEQFLATFGYVVDKNRTYITKSGKQARGIVVEGTDDYYRVYVPVRKAGSLGAVLGVPVGALVAIVVALAFAVGVFYLYKIQSLINEAHAVSIAAMIEAQNNYTRCVAACNTYTDDELKRKCLAGCENAYNTTMNEVRKVYEHWKSSNVLGDVKELIKWGVIGVIAIEAVRALRGGEK